MKQIDPIMHPEINPEYTTIHDALDRDKEIGYDFIRELGGSTARLNTPYFVAIIENYKKWADTQ